MGQEMVGVGSGAAVAVDVAPQPNAATSAAPARLGYVDGLRALAALYVVAHHCMLEFWPYAIFPNALVEDLAGWAQYGHYAVSVFIVLSGFSLMLPVARKGYRLPWGVWGFYWRRARRILPPYYFAMGLSLLLIWLFIGHATGTHWDVALPVTGNSIVTHILLLQDFSMTDYATINHAFWSIAMECQIYLLFPALILLWRRYPPPFAMFLVVTLSLILLFALIPTSLGQASGYAVIKFAPQYIGLFAMGMFAASVYTAPTLLWDRLRSWHVWEALALMCFALAAFAFYSEPMYILDLPIGIGTAGLLLAAARPARFNPVRAALEWRPLVWVGGFSYSLYLIHAPLIQLLWQYALHPLGLGDLTTFLALLVVGLPLIVLAAWGFWYCCERPFLNTRAGSGGATASGGPAE